jgi:tetratricopeptide (TPR) repeat protein
VAVADFERAVELDPRYASAHVGLANARFWQYEMSRARNEPDVALLARAIDHVRCAIELQRDLGEAHATLSFLLMSAGRANEALSAARRAVGLEPGYWGNQFRLAHAAWGRSGCRRCARDGPVRRLPVRALRDGDGPLRAERSIEPSRSSAKAPSSRTGRPT